MSGDPMDGGGGFDGSENLKRARGWTLILANGG
jgi:hypothetical protein